MSALCSIHCIHSEKSKVKWDLPFKRLIKARSLDILSREEPWRFSLCFALCGGERGRRRPAVAALRCAVGRTAACAGATSAKHQRAAPAPRNPNDSMNDLFVLDWPPVRSAQKTKLSQMMFSLEKCRDERFIQKLSARTRELVAEAKDPGSFPF
jgi:hypothetical protein